MTSLKFCVRVSRKLGFFPAGSTRLVRFMNIGRCVNQYVAALFVASCGALCLAGCSTARDVHTASDSELENRRTEINRKIDADDFGLSFGLTRWVSHAAEKNKVLKEKEQIDAELLRRRRSANVGRTRSSHVAPNVSASSTDNLAGPPGEGTTAPSQSQFPTAKRVPDKPGFVFSPSDPSKYVDVSGYPSGSKVKDPYSGKIFTVP
jgi:coenzyme F420-reducing hydrogenase delta subunit